VPVLLIHGRDDRMVPFEVSIGILNHIAGLAPRAAHNNCGHWPPSRSLLRGPVQVLVFLHGY
jgi:hypothetical protein